MFVCFFLFNFWWFFQHFWLDKNIKNPMVEWLIVTGPPWIGEVVLFDCDDFTQKFYKEYLGTDQRANRLDVSEKPVTHLKSLGQQRSTHIFLHWWYEDSIFCLPLERQKSWLLVARSIFFPLMPESWTESQVNSSTPQWSGQRGGFLDFYTDDQCQGLHGWVVRLVLARICRIHPFKMNTEPKNEGLEDDFPFQRGDLQVPC